MDRCLHNGFCLATKVHVKRCRIVFILVSAPTSPQTLLSYHAHSLLSFPAENFVTQQSSMPLTTVKRSRDSTPVATHSPKMVKRPRPSNATTLVGAFVRQAISSKQSTLSSTYGHFTRLPQSKAKNRPQLQVELPRVPSLEFIGLSPITSFLSDSSYSDFSLSSSASSDAENTDQFDNQDELLELGIIQGLSLDGHPHHEVPYSMLYDNVTPER
jgi:hypothetical protein